jgi:hypothetical protein
MTLRKVRNEKIQLYRLRTPPERALALLVEYINQANDLAARPKFYNTLKTNCTTTIFTMMRAVPSSIPFDWRIILAGYLADYLCEHGAVDTRISLEEQRQRADVTSRVDQGLNEFVRVCQRHADRRAIAAFLQADLGGLAHPQNLLYR